MVRLLLYLSVGLGVVFLAQIYGIVRPSLFYTVLAGWFAYLALAVGVRMGWRLAYPLIVPLAILGLAASLIPRAHYGLIGDPLPGATFLLGTGLQLALLVATLLYLLKGRQSAS